MWVWWSSYKPEDWTLVVTRRTGKAFWQEKKVKTLGVQLDKPHIFPIKIKGKKSNTSLCKLSSPGWGLTALCAVQDRMECTGDLTFVALHFDPQHLLKFLQSYSNLLLKTHWPEQAVGTKAQIATDIYTLMSWPTSWSKLGDYLLFKAELHVLGII